MELIEQEYGTQVLRGNLVLARNFVAVVAILDSVGPGTIGSNHTYTLFSSLTSSPRRHEHKVKKLTLSSKDDSSGNGENFCEHVG